MKKLVLLFLFLAPLFAYSQMTFNVGSIVSFESNNINSIHVANAASDLLGTATIDRVDGNGDPSGHIRGSVGGSVEINGVSVGYSAAYEIKLVPRDGETDVYLDWTVTTGLVSDGGHKYLGTLPKDFPGVNINIE